MTIQKISSVPLTDLKTLRITCRKCGGVIEVPIQSAGNASSNGGCRLCGNQFALPRDLNKMTVLAEAIDAITKQENEFTVEFPIRDANT
jgi:hypothetical protein